MTTKKIERRIKIKYRIRKNVFGTAERPRLSVFRSNKQILIWKVKHLHLHPHWDSRLCRRSSRLRRSVNC